MLDPHHWSRFVAFDAAQGVVIRSPEASGAGYWVGAPTVFFDEHDQQFYLVYRLRRPRGVEPDRGAEVYIARGRDGIGFETIWKATKDQLGTTSIERCALARGGDGRWRLYVSYVDPADGRWRIDLVEADRPEALDLRTAQPVLTAAEIGAEGIKDPFLFRVAGLWHMIASYATAEGTRDAAALHGTQDCYNTGLIRSRSGLATSHDGLSWQWEGEIFGPSRSGWDSYCARIGCVWREDGLWLALYDGSRDASQNYEEQCGLAYSHDLRRFHRVSRGGPLLAPPQGRGGLRYFDVLTMPGVTYFYYEMALADGSHDLRVLRHARLAT